MKRVLVLQPGGIGDTVVSMPALRALKEAFPGGRVDVALVESAPRAILTKAFCDSVFALSYAPARWRDLIKNVLELRRQHYDICFVPSGVNPWKAGLFAWLAGAKVRVGERRGAIPALLYTGSVPLDTNLHIVESNEQILSLLGVPVRQKVPSLKPQPEAVKKADEFFSLRGLSSHPVLGLHLGSPMSGGAKRWPLEHVERFGAMLKDKKPQARILIFGAPKELEFCREAAGRIGDTALLAVGQALGDSVALLARCAAFLGVDGGLAHVAAALGVPTVALFGPMDSRRNGPRGKRVIIIQEYCSDMRITPDLPSKGAHHCMERMSPERVFRELTRAGF